MAPMPVKKLTASKARARLTTFETEIMNPLLAELRPQKYTWPTDHPGSPFVVEEAMQGIYAVHDYLRRVASELEGQ